ncbi:MAG: indolepyruvate ferredoxin oxidoreductase family protein [Thalassobaculales bacterium]
MAARALADVSLSDKYEVERGRVYLTGVQALVRLPMMQRRRDEKAGLNTAAFISGYRGSPLGGFDQQLWQARPFLERHHITFQPGINEDLAATAVWGSQQVNLFPGARYDGVFAMWYGKGPGVDRTGDVFKHANFAGTSRHGGVLALAGDDHACKSSTLPSQSEYAFMDAMIPVLHPANVQEVLDYGLYGWAMSRYAGVWVAMKCLADTMDSSASVSVDPDRVKLVLPADFPMPPGGLNIRWPDPPMEQEYRLQRHKLYAALAFATANRIDRVVMDSPNPRFGIVTTGKTYLDVRQALEDLGIDDALAAAIGLRVYKVGMVWPLEREGIRHFAEGLEEILVVEEKRAVIENQMKEQLYNWREDVRPKVVGKFDEKREWILPSAGELTPARIARVIAARLEPFFTSPAIRERLAFLEQKERALAASPVKFDRMPYFCSGCPHNTSTRVPEGSRAMAGIGCHYMAIWMDRDTETFTQMGGEGAPWIGQAPFTETRHVFANLGDGTYTHSGLLAIRAAVAAGVNITYKLLFNDAVAMTGGQPADAALTPADVVAQVLAEGVKLARVVSEDPERYPLGYFPSGVTIHHRDDLEAVQKELREQPGVTLLLYDQTCAAEKRRRRKRGKLADPPRRAFINELVCEGCGDCGVQSNCVSITPVETAFGRKRAIDQSSCNKDLSCLKGFCPSFVTIEGGSLRKQAAAARPAELPPPPDPVVPAVDRVYSILVGGVGGTGVVTIGALLGMAAHVEGLGVSVLDMTGLAQKGGTVFSHIRLAPAAEALNAPRIPAGEADLVVGCDLVVAASHDSLAKVQRGLTRMVVNTAEVTTGDFTKKPDLQFPAAGMRKAILEAAGEEAVAFVDAGALATALLGDSIAANLFMLGFAWQRGLVPLSAAAIDRAIAINGVAVGFNRAAFLWGRRAAHDAGAVAAAASPPAAAPEPESLERMVARRSAFLAAYQDRAYAARYEALVRKVEAAERGLGLSGLAEAAARYAFKLMAYKDEYEVARLHADPAFRQAIARQFEGDYRIAFHLAPPLLARVDPASGLPRKQRFGPWMMLAFRLLARLKFLRGSRFDIFGRTEERRMERQLVAEYFATVDHVLAHLRPDNHAAALALLSLPEQIRGFGHVKARHLAAARQRQADLRAAFDAPRPALPLAAE